VDPLTEPPARAPAAVESPAPTVEGGDGAETAMLEAAVRHLAAIARPSASPGEKAAAAWIAARLEEEGATVEIDEESAHGTYWRPFALLTAIGAAGGLAALRGRRATGLVAGAFAAAGMWGEVGGGSLWFRRRFLSHRPCWNVVAEAGDRDARETLVLFAHHDAARSGLVFHPALLRTVAEALPGLHARATVSPPLFWLVIGGPGLVAAGALAGRRSVVRAGTILATACLAAFADIASRDTVPGANDNATGVATLLGVARKLRRRPVDGLRVLLVSAGAEESFQEGIGAFGRRHFARLSPPHTRMLCVDTVGSPQLTTPESEGMLVHRGFTPEMLEALSESAREAGVHLGRGLRFSFSTDAIVPLRAGYRTAMLGSVDELKAPSNYHWPTDDADNVDYERVADAVRLCETLIRRLARSAAPGSAPA